MALKVGKGAEAPPFLVMDVIAAANAREAALPPGAPGVLRMEVGQPSTGAPRGAAEAAIRALQGGAPLGYTEAFGLRPLRERIAGHYREKYGVAVPPSRVAVTVGASGAFPLAFLAAFDVGDRVAMAAPFYPPYANILTALGMVPQVLPCDASTRFQPTVAMLEALDPRPAGLIVASPCNPAGTMLSRDELAAIADWCERNGVRLVSDEIYHGLSYGMEESTAAGCSDSAIVVNSFSKYFSMTGWRIGWMVLPEDLVRPVECLAQNMFISAPHIAQVAAEAAFGCAEELEANKAVYARNRALLLRGLPEAGFDKLAEADGAFYLWADIGHLTNDSVGFAARMLAEAGIAATPGVDFDPARGGRFLRFSYCGAEAAMAEAPGRLRDWLRR
ncbi:aminotransferase class I/II-fold pyridoxal phosphate-dependent enzyme [Pseudoroseomonas wenyumeiae]|uniref:Aminotransferase n=1 Tax=Teichococcus wenyumeiae TaxID=2478470 RepID=A0A3A9J6A4_9PROT|nr:aminotransferase class I/II-fold pyridoxal phosphate-dependent enzyme [Pseudoroseomonas wenyumeiae]RKK01450.1 aminotransferase class I/II-fold pyridoxal phosphate-dependent enzyme [Pseudoroseomonas wenyumeiae]RMI20850.1 aminotransferase class I/II-fold pyridoxal phosphate-dependent enzyme [Pseudoroseomonas wenyumeiae]